MSDIVSKWVVAQRHRSDCDLGDEIRDQLIALEHAASHIN